MVRRKEGEISGPDRVSLFMISEQVLRQCYIWMRNQSMCSWASQVEAGILMSKLYLLFTSRHSEALGTLHLLNV